MLVYVRDTTYYGHYSPLFYSERLDLHKKFTFVVWTEEKANQR